jgi:hypothetical protein
VCEGDSVRPLGGGVFVVAVVVLVLRVGGGGGGGVCGVGVFMAFISPRVCG